jgi:hypothetical protein
LFLRWVFLRFPPHNPKSPVFFSEVVVVERGEAAGVVAGVVALLELLGAKKIDDDVLVVERGVLTDVTCALGGKRGFTVNGLIVGVGIGVGVYTGVGVGVVGLPVERLICDLALFSLVGM